MEPSGRINMNMSSYQYRKNSHYKDRNVLHLSWESHTWKDGFYIETATSSPTVKRNRYYLSKYQKHRSNSEEYRYIGPMNPLRNDNTTENTIRDHSGYSPVNERLRYNVTLSLVGLAHTQNDPWLWHSTHCRPRQDDHRFADEFIKYAF